MGPEFFSDLILFAEHAMRADYSKLRKTGQALAKKIEKSDPERARAFRSAINRKGLPLQASGLTEILPVDNKSRLPLIEEHLWPTCPIFLNADAKEKFSAFLSDVENFELLAANGISSKLSLLMSGPPGTGKTLLAGHIASQLGKSLYVVRLDSIISSMLGDTAKNIRSVFDFIAGKDAVLFLDELDAVAKKRDDRNELGELKRVVNTVIQGIDSLDERAIVIAATNHPQMLDTAIWRRFSYKLNLDPPELELRQALWSYFLNIDDELDYQVLIMASISNGLSGADIEQFALAARREAIINKQEIDFIRLAFRLVFSDKKNNYHEKKPIEVRRELARSLVGDYDIAQTEIARFLGVSRQVVYSYIKV